MNGERFARFGRAASWLCLAAVMLAVRPTCAEDYRVGVARIDVTPDFPVRLSGFRTRRVDGEATEVSQRIWAKALVIDDGQPVVLITLDNCGINADHTAELSRRLEKQAGIRRDRLALTVTHTHSAPMLRGVLPNIFGEPIPPGAWAHIDRYTEQLLDKLEKVSLDALADRRPARISWGVGTSDLSINRRDPKGPLDRDLPVMAIHDPDGKLRAVYISYACHCVTLRQNKISGDWAGYAQEWLEKSHPGSTALVSVGCGADCNPRSGVTLDKVELASEQGGEIAREVDRVLSGFLAPVTGPITTDLRQIELALVPATKEALRETAKLDDPYGYNARVQLAELDRGTFKTKIDYPIEAWRFGDSLAMVFLAGEVVTDYSLRLKRELDGRRLWVNAYSNDVPCYIPSEQVLQVGGYEGGQAMAYYSLPGPLATGVEQKIVDATIAAVGPAFAAPVDSTRTGGSLPLSPQQSVAAIRVPPGFVAELMVAEPLVIDPVAIQWGPDGRMWVVEMHDYPEGVQRDFKAGGRIRVLEDIDGDGRYDKSTVFLDGILFPTGVTPWRKGVMVCAAPDILYAEDADGDGRADVVRKLFAGFGTDNYQGRVNSLEYSLDNWVHGSCGLFGGKIAGADAAQVFELGNRNFRIRPDEGLLEPATGRTQQGCVRDDWGNWFGCTNSELCVHYPLEDRYLRRAAHVEPPAAAVTVPGYPDPQRLYSIKADVQLFKLSGKESRSTAACGLGIYRDELLGPEFRGNTFTCEPVHLVVHRMVLSPRGSTFSGGRGADESESEFLASTDNWFRPVQARTGPDGGLWVVDMCRYVIEHPRWIPPEDLAKLDTRAGDTLGRIYRIRPAGAVPRKVPRLDQYDAAELVAAIDSPNGWQRDMAGQLLLWRGERSAAPGLEALAASAARPETRLHALCILEGLGVLTPSGVLAALQDAHPGVRRHAIRLSEPFLASSSEMGPALLALIDDSDPQVRLQLACSLGQWSDPRSGPALVRTAMHDPADPYLTAAALSSVGRDNVGGALATAFENRQAAPPMPLGAQLLALAVALGESAQLPSAVARFTTPREGHYADWQMTALAEVLTALARSGQKLEQLQKSGTLEPIQQMLADARRIAGEEQATEEERLAAIGALGHDPAHAETEMELLTSLLVPQNSSALQAASIAALGRIPDPRVGSRLLDGWQAHTPALRADVLALVLSREIWQNLLLDALEAGRVSPAQFDARSRQRLLAHPNELVRQRADKLFAGASDASRQKVLDDYRPALSLTADRDRGKLVFVRICANCHRLQDLGHTVGPDLATQARGKPPEFVLIEVLDPNKNTDTRYTEYVAVTTAGTIVTGILTSETSTAITLAGPEGKQQTILRSEIEQLRSTGKSLMPEGLEKDISQQQMADLIAFVLSASAEAPQPQASGQ